MGSVKLLYFSGLFRVIVNIFAECDVSMRDIYGDLQF